jgi:hypothetical protein
MPRVRLLTLSLTVALCALTSHVGAQTAPVPTISAKVLPPPVQIVRKPATLIAPVAPLTNRVLPPATVTQLISSGLKLNVGSLKPVAKPPGQKALIIVMYNGGIVKNIDPNLQQKLQATNLRQLASADAQSGRLAEWCLEPGTRERRDRSAVTHQHADLL